MSFRIHWLACGLVLLLSFRIARAADEVRLVGLDGRGQANSPPVAVMDNRVAVFGDREQGLDLEMDTPSIQAGSLRADWFQVVGYAMPLAKNILVKDGLTFPAPPPYHMHVTLKFPEVKGPTQITLLLALFPKPGATPINCRPLWFEVYPASTTKELTDLLQPKSEGSAPVVVFGSGQKLRQFFKSQHVSFEDGGAGIPDRFDPSRLYFGELATNEEFQQTQDHSAGARLVLFSPDESLPPGVYADRSNSGVLIHVTLPLLDNLAEDPRAQLGLTKIIHLLTAQPPSAN